ncbi:MAG TPA: hypothetical protein VF405_10825 [Gammaproteobacteria bacterium]
MSSWVAAALMANAALVVVAIVLAVRIAGRSAAGAVNVSLEYTAAIAVLTPDAGGGERLPLFTRAQMIRTEWRALLAAYDAARIVYAREHAARRDGGPRPHGALGQALHDLHVAERRLMSFEREIVRGSTALFSR